MGDRPRIHSSHGSPSGSEPRGARAEPASPRRAKTHPASRSLAPRRALAAEHERANGAEPRLHPDHTGTPGKPQTARRPKVASAHAGPRSKRPKNPVAAPPSGSVASDAARELAIAIAVAAIEKKAVGLEILDVAGKVDYADFLVLMTGRSDRQVAALAQGIEEALRQHNRRALSIEGLPHASWVLMDFGDVVVHVFQDDARSLYDIEGLWMDARRIPVPLPETLR